MARPADNAGQLKTATDDEKPASSPDVETEVTVTSDVDASPESDSAKTIDTEGPDATPAGNDDFSEADVAEADGAAEITATERGVRKLSLPSLSTTQKGLAVGFVVVLALTGLAGWLGLRTYEATQAAQTRELFLQVGRQGAVNLTSIDFQSADADVQRILDSATGFFYDDFSARSQAFVDVVKQTQSKTAGSVTEAGIESADDFNAQILVAVKVTTSNAAAGEQEPRNWRMRVSVQKFDDQAKVSNVEFVP
jgi:Mce-associated membrane protein